MHLTNWKARRAGGRITVNGTNAEGQPAKIVGVDVIEPSAPGHGFVKAIDKNGDEHSLAIPR
jgi:hypothetical protein